MYDKQQIKYVYKHLRTGYNAAQTMPEKKRRTYLAQWMTDPALSHFVDGMTKQHKHHLRAIGNSVPHLQRDSRRRNRPRRRLHRRQRYRASSVRRTSHGEFLLLVARRQ
ncbi:MAG: hypothetical protein ACRDMV_05125 [Streptosporangiales bacterium]